MADVLISEFMDKGVAEGAKLVVDGRNFSLQGYERAILTPNRAEFARLMRTIGTLRHLCLSNSSFSQPA
mgnify:CR=1 FL=1